MPEASHETALSAPRATTQTTDIRLLHVAMVHLFLRTPARRPRRRAPDTADLETLTSEQRYRQLTRLFSNWVGQPERCALALCRRAKLCRGEPADCWRDEPPPSPEEIENAKWMTKQAITGELKRRRAAGELPAEDPQS